MGHDLSHPCCWHLSKWNRNQGKRKAGSCISF